MHSESVSTGPGDNSVPAAMVIGGATAVDFRRPAVLDVATERAIALYRAIFVNSPEAIAIVGPDGKYLEQNSAHESTHRHRGLRTRVEMSRLRSRSDG